MRKLLRVMLTFSVAWRAFCAEPDQPLDVSVFSSRGVDLSPYYQAVVREATELYRGDVVGHIGTHSWTCFGSQRLLYAQVDSDPFPAELVSLYNPGRPKDARSTCVSLQVATPNDVMQPTKDV